MTLLNQLRKLKMAEPTNYHEDTKKLLEQIASTTSELDNILIRQKDMILANLDKATKPTDFMEVAGQVELASELWRALNYGYKISEILDKLHTKVSTYETKHGEIKIRVVPCDPTDVLPS